MTHGAYRSTDAVSLQALKAEEVATILADRGFDARHPPALVRVRMAEALAGLLLVLGGLERFIGSEPISGKGRAKRALPLYLQTLDRVIRLAALVGLDRVTRTVHESPRDWLLRAQTHAAEPLDVTADDDASPDRDPDIGND